MICGPRRRQSGFLVVTVVVILGVLAAIALMLSASVAMDNALVARHADRNSLDYLAESGMEHAKWQLAQSTSCSAYQNLPVTPFGDGTYLATVTPTDGSPVSIVATGTLADGAARTLTLDNVSVHNRETAMTAIIAPGAEGKDTFIEEQSGHTDHNKGDDNHLKTRSDSTREYRTLIEFDLSSLPTTAIIQSATLTIELQTAGSADAVEAYRLLRHWTEGGSTWDTYDGTNAWDTPGGDYDPVVAGSFLGGSTGAKSMDLTDLAKAWVNGSLPNYGLILLSPASPGGNENTYHSSDIGGGSQPKLSLSYFCECGAVCTGMSSGHTVILSTETQANLGGLTFEDTDLANYDGILDTATLFMDGALTTLNETINAVHVLENGHIVLSARHATTLGGLNFNDEDLVEYDPVNDTATMYFDGSEHFADNEDIISLHILNSGNLVLSTYSNASLGGLSFSNRDLVEYDPVLGTASIFFDGDAAGLTQNIGAVHVLESGQLILGFWGDTTLGGVSVTAADLIQYDATADTATLYLPGATLFSNSNEEISSVHINGDFGPPVLSALNVLFVVPDSGSLTSDDDQRKALMESWGFTVNLIDDSDSQADYDAAAGVNDVVYVGEEIVSTEIGDKLGNLSIGVVNEEQQLRDELGFASHHGKDYFVTDIDIVDAAHDITSGFTTGGLTITSSNQPMQYLQDTLSPDLKILADFPSLSQPSLAVLNIGDTLYDGGNATGRRVWLPWGGNAFQFAALTNDGQIIMRRAIEWAADSTAASAPFAHWQLDEVSGTVATDHIGGHDGTLTSGPAWVPGVLGGGLSFDGVNDYIDVSSMNPMPYDDFTISAWYKSADTSVSDDEYIYVHVEGFIVNGITLGPTDDGSDDDKLRLTIDVDNVADRHYGSSDIVDQQWHHLVAVRSGGRIKLYVDSVKEADEADAHAGLTLTVDGDGPFIGDLPGSTEQVHGILDDVRLYDRELSVEEITAMYVAGGGGGGGGGGGSTGTYRDEFNTNGSFAGNDGTLTWSTDWLEIGESNGAGSGDIMTTTDASQYQLRVRDNDNGGEGVEREADLSGCSSASLTFDYRRNGLDSSNDYVAISVSNNGGSSWSELDRLQGAATDSSYQSANYDISTETASNTRIRFLGSPTLGGSDTVFFDNVEIECQ